MIAFLDGSPTVHFFELFGMKEIVFAIDDRIFCANDEIVFCLQFLVLDKFVYG